MFDFHTGHVARTGAAATPMGAVGKVQAVFTQAKATWEARAVAPGGVAMAREPVDVTIAAPTGPLGVSFKGGTTTVLEASPTSPLVGKVQAGDVLASVDGVAVSADTFLQTLKDKDTGGERTLVFKRGA